jgi:hypothetical protein
VNEINRVLSSGLLVFAGICLNILLNNYIITTIGCFLLGLVLSRGYKRRPQRAAASKSQLAQTSQISAPPRSPPTGAGIRCSNCGSFASDLTNYCASCGSRLKWSAPSIQSDPGRYSPQLIESSLSKVRDEDQAAYAGLVQNLLMVDQQGRYWSIGANSSKWYVQGAEEWVPSRSRGNRRFLPQLRKASEHATRADCDSSSAKNSHVPAMWSICESA